MSDKYTRKKIRDFELTEEDAARLAECFNSFDDSDSWPGGFTGGTPFTAQRVLERTEKTDNIRVIVAVDGDKIVGHCNLCHAELDREGAYVGLLGVRPDYQGRGYGKAMLIAATETAARIGKRRVDLHTWAGNLKAMPLYKRIGFNWVPNTRVLMESYIPEIITTPLFEEFFRRNYWYDALKQKIEQAPDDISKDGIGIFEYHFEGENGDQLDVIIDRHAKGMCGFKLTIDGRTTEAHVLPESQIGYIAVGAVPVRLAIKNETGEKLQTSVEVKPSEKLRAVIDGPTQFNMDTEEKVVVTGTYEVTSQARPHSKTEPYVKVKTWAQWTLQFGNKIVNMYSGVIPQDAITFSTGPEFVSTNPAELANISFELKNNTQEKVKGKVVLTEPKDHILSWHTFDFEIEPNSTLRKHLEVETSSDDLNSVITVRTAIFIEKERAIRIKDTTVPIAVLGPQGAVAYETCSDRAVLETEEFRVEFAIGPKPIIETIEYKTIDKTISGWLFAPCLGYPFPEGGEWISKEYRPKYINSCNSAEVVFEGESKDRPGLHIKFIYRAHAGNGEIELLVEFENRGTKRIKNLGFKTVNWSNSNGTKLYVPLRNKIFRLADPRWGSGGQLPNKPENYHETWYAVTDEENGCVFGAIWERKGMVQFRPIRAIRPPLTEYKIRDLEPGENLKKQIIRTYFLTGTWRKIRAIWSALYGETASMDEYTTLPSALEVTLKPLRGRIVTNNSTVVFVDGTKRNRLQLGIEVVHSDLIVGTARISAPPRVLLDKKKKIQFDFETSIDHPVEREIVVEIEEEKWLSKGGEIVLEFSDRIARVPFKIIRYNSNEEIGYSKKKYREFTLFTMVSGSYRLSTSPEHAGGLVAYGLVNGHSAFYETFPEVKPFAWVDLQYSGLIPFIVGHQVWDWESSLRQERWILEKVERGPLVGHRVKTTLKHAEKMQGVLFTYEYLLLKGTPLMNVTMIIENTSDHWKRFEAGLVGVPASGTQEKDRLHLVRDGQRIIYEPTPNAVRLSPDASAGWFVFERPDGEVLGIYSTTKTRQTIKVDHIGEAGHFLGLSDKFHLRPGQRVTRGWWFLHGKNVEDAIDISDLPSPII